MTTEHWTDEELDSKVRMLAAAIASPTSKRKLKGIFRSVLLEGKPPKQVNLSLSAAAQDITEMKLVIPTWERHTV